MYKLKKLTLKNLLERSADLFSERTALAEVDGKLMSYATFSEEVQKLSLFLHNQGIVTGDKVALLSENMINWGISFFAITNMGAIVVPILPDFHSNEINHIIQHSGSKALFVSKRLYDKLEDEQLETLSIIILIDDFTIIPIETNKDKIKELKKMVKNGTKEFAKLKEAVLRKTGKIPSEVQENNIASIIYTSGTTGRSKGVMLTHKNLVFDAEATLSIVKVTEKDKFISILPLSHTYECTLGFILPIMQGASIYYLDKPPAARILLPAMAKIKPTMMLSVPLLIEKIYKLRILPKLTGNVIMKNLFKIAPIRKQLHKKAGKKLLTSFGGKLHFFGIGGALLSAEVEIFLRDAEFPYAIGYGLTETSPLVAGSNPQITRFRAVGPILPEVEVKIDNPNPKTGEGEILVKGANVMRGYYNDPENTKAVFTDDGWFKTGDLGIMKRKYLYIKGRLKNMILGPSGENIYPEDIEANINRFDYVLESIVFKLEGKLIARVHLNYEELDKEYKRKKLSEQQIQKNIKELLKQLRKEVNTRLSSFARINKIIEQTEPFEKTPSKKIKRFLYTN